MSQSDEISKVNRLADRAWTEQGRALFTLQSLGQPIARLPKLSLAEAEARADLGKQLLSDAASIDLSALPHEEATTVRVVTTMARRWSHDADWWWLVQDMNGLGWYTITGPTAYGGGMALSTVSKLLDVHRFEGSGDLDRYLGLVADYADIVDQMRLRLEGQVERRIGMARPQLKQSVKLVAGFREAARTAFRVEGSRLNGVERTDRFQRDLRDIVSGPIDDAMAKLEAVLNGPCSVIATDQVGLSQYAGGGDVYAELVRAHTTLDLSPEQVHALGLERMAEVRDAMAEVRSEAGFGDDDVAYWRSVEADPAWRAQGDDAIIAVFQRYIDRIEPHVGQWFRFMPKAPYGVAALPQQLRATMTFGYYQTPRYDGDSGRYIFNADNISKGTFANIAALTYHELIPGHHFHIASQMENPRLHPMRANTLFNVFNEGWAEYAANVAGEMGLYEQPQERFGRLVNDAFLTSRLVVDTGLNALGWSLEKARDYMRQNSFMPETEIRSETLRYACGMPGQALGYKVGVSHLMDERRRMRAALGADFDVRDFHDAVLRPGGLPLALVSENIDRAITERRA
jgi:uncharacterized protein (DUF885 family)